VVSGEGDSRAGARGKSRRLHRFTGKEDDLAVGVTYFGKRYLVPALGRCASADPLAVHSPGSADLNVYAYVHGQLLSATDPTGLDEESLTSDTNNYADQKYAEESLNGNKTQSGTVHKGGSGARQDPPPAPTGDRSVAFKDAAAGLALGTTQALTPGGAPHLNEACMGNGRCEFFRGAGQVATGVAEMYHGTALVITGGQAAGVSLAAEGPSLGSSTTGVAAGGAMAVSGALIGIQGVSSVLGGIQTLMSSGSGGPGAGSSSDPTVSAGDPPKKRGGESQAAADGRAAHNNYPGALGPDYDYEVKLPSGKKADAVHKFQPEVRELKPDNPKAIRKGEKQAAGYAPELESMPGETRKFTTTVDTYKPRTKK
jgi:RHS repeat-associated protein